VVGIIRKNPNRIAGLRLILLPPAAAAPPTAARLPAIAAATAGRFGTISSRSFAEPQYSASLSNILVFDA